MKRNLILIFVLLLALFNSCQNDTENGNLVGDKTSTDISDDAKKENEEDNIGTAYIMNGSLYNINWYVPDVSIFLLQTQKYTIDFIIIRTLLLVV